MYLYKNPLLKRSLIKGIILLSIAFVFAIILGLVIGHINNMKRIESLFETKKPSMPSTVYDRNGEVITTFYSDEKRDLVTLDMIPEYLVDALIIYEDSSFYQHNGFNLLSILRATLNNVLRRPVSGASTLTQQLARTLFLTNKFSWERKIRELWIAIQLEKKFTKNEILTLYFNHVPLGYGTNGVQAASQFYFNKNIEDLDYAEAASIITLISNPSYYSFISKPKNHKTKQKTVLRKMVANGIITQEEADRSMENFWQNWENTTHSSRGAFYNREDKAPYYSDWIVQHINKNLPGVDVYRDGLEIHTTIDLRWNKIVEDMYAELLEKQQKIFEVNQIKTYNVMQSYYLDSVMLMADTFSINNVYLNRNRNKSRGITKASKDIIPILNMTSHAFGLSMISEHTEKMLNEQEQSKKKLISEVQGAFIAIDNKTGQIIVMIGGRKFDPTNRFNYAMQAKRQPGSSFKPFVYSAAFDTKTFTPGSVIIDKPYIFKFGSENPDEWYTPYNYGAKYHGPVTLREALQRSLNIPACIVFYTIGINNGYKVPIDRAAKLLGINSQAEIQERFEPSVSTVLGTGSVSPVEMANAFSVFANGGIKSIPNTIIKIEDANGKIIYDPWKDLKRYYRENSKKLQVISPQNAYIMTDILKGVVNSHGGTLNGVKHRIIREGLEFPDVEFAGKTGTTQNWSDAWVICYSPEITVAGWTGFDKYGLSLGYEQSGSSVLGPIVLEFMRQYHENKDGLKFKEPDGLSRALICKYSGLRPSDYCDESTTYVEYFLPGTVPIKECTYCKQNQIRNQKNSDLFLEKYEMNYTDFDMNDIFGDEKIEVDKNIINQYSTLDDIDEIEENKNDDENKTLETNKDATSDKTIE